LSWLPESEPRGSQLMRLGDGAGVLISGFLLVSLSLRSNNFILMRIMRQVKAFEVVSGV